MKMFGLIELNATFFWQIFNTGFLLLLLYLIIRLIYKGINKLSSQSKIEALEERVNELESKLKER